MGWYRRSSRLLFDVFRGYSSRFDASKNIKNFQASSLKQPSFSKRVSETWQSHSSLRNEIKKNQLQSPLWDVAKRFYYVDRQQVHHFKPRGYKGWLQNPRNVFIVVVVSSGVVISVYFGNLETVPYTKRTHFVLLSRALEIQLGEAQFQEMKKQFKGRILPPLHPNSIRVLNVAHDIIEALQKGLRNDQVWSDTRYSPEFGVLHQDGMHAHSTAKALSDKFADNDKWLSEDKWHKEDEVLDDKWVQQSRKKGKDKGVASQHLQGLNWEVVVVNDPLVNAICFPGGKIIVFTGLLEHFRADAEIATIVGHEVSHAVARHSAEQISKNLWLTIFQLILCMFVAPDIVSTMSNLLLRLPFSRRMEMEADYIGLLLMASAGYDPRVAPQVYEKLGRVVGDSPLQDYLATHPSGKKRAQLLARAKVMEEALGIYREAVAGRAVEGFL